jgi:hypothetical protein
MNYDGATINPYAKNNNKEQWLIFFVRACPTKMYTRVHHVGDAVELNDVIIDEK